MFEKFEVIEVNNQKYIILNIVNHNNQIYLYLINEDENNDDHSIVKVIQNNDKLFFEEINEEEYKIIVGKLLMDNKNELYDILSIYEQN